LLNYTGSRSSKRWSLYNVSCRCRRRLHERECFSRSRDE